MMAIGKQFDILLFQTAKIPDFAEKMNKKCKEMMRLVAFPIEFVKNTKKISKYCLQIGKKVI